MIAKTPEEAAAYDAGRHDGLNELEVLTASEALFGFAGWLASRDKEIAFSCTADIVPVMELLEEFCETNQLAEPRSGWGKILRMPVGSNV